MRIDSNTTIAELMHHELDSDELYHWKYVKREKINGKWRYYYDWDEWKSDAKTKADAITSATLKKSNELSKGLDKLVTKAKDIFNKLYDDPDNMYDINSGNYQKKLDQVKQTKEWQDIVAKKDPEYVKKNEDGSYTYKIDDYIVKKKHPVLDVLSDIIAGREVDTNEITKESTIAGLKDHAIGYIRTGALALGVLSTFMTEKFKLQQGSYDDEIAELTATTDAGRKYVESTLDTVSKVSVEDVEKLATAVHAGSMAAEAKRTIDEGNVVAAAQTIINSEQMRSVLGNDEYYNMVNSVMSNLSTEEVAALNLLLKQLRK